MSKRSRAGDLRHVVTVQAPSTALDTFGQNSTGWTTERTLRAEIQPLQGYLGSLARQRYPEATHQVTVEYHSSLASTGATAKRLLYDSRALYIKGILNSFEEGRDLRLMVGESR